MIHDVSAVMWKEYKEVFARRGIRTISLFVLPIFLMGVFLPWQMGVEWLNSPIGMLLWAWLPAFLVVSFVADSFAGERERHTLETLLASRLPDRAILFGKIGISVLYAWTMTLAGMAVALVTVNLMYGGNGLLMYSTETLLVGVSLGALIAIMMATGGVLISLRASTVRQAQQIISIMFLVPWFALMFGSQVIPAEWKASITAGVGGMSLGGVFALLEAIVVIVDLCLVAAAIARFKRVKLALD
jgi:ABC-2 type transport system permease protein